MDDFLLNGLSLQKALVTGAASGIGRAVSLMLGRTGVALALTDVNETALQSTALEVRALGATAHAIPADLADLASVEATFDTALAMLGQIDILVNCAGAVGRTAKLTDVDLDDWRRVQSIDLEAPLFLMKAFARHALSRGGGGRIVNVSSSSAFHVSGQLAYSCAKAALNTASRFAARELGPHGITVNAVVPGVTRTPMFPGDADQAVRSGPLANYLGRAAEAEDVAAVIVFLCTPAARQMTGQFVHTNAGAV